MKGAVAVFVKTPGLSEVKTRLAKDTGKAFAQDFYERCIHTVTSIVQSAVEESACQLFPYWAVGEPEGLNSEHWGTFPAIYTGPGNLSERMYHVYTKLLEDHDYIILIGTDSPQLDPRLIMNADHWLTADHEFIVGPSKDGGFYLLAGRKALDAEKFTGINCSCDTTFAELLGTFGPNDAVKILKEYVDVDFRSDLYTLVSEFAFPVTDQQKVLRDWLIESGYGMPRNRADHFRFTSE